MRGRPRKAGERHPSGRLKQPTRDTLLVVLAQPHRKGETSQLAGSAIGRFILIHQLRSECYDAAEQWASVKRKWLSAMGAKLPVKTTGTGADIPMEVVREWRDQDAGAMAAMIRYAGKQGFASVESMAVHDEDFRPGANPHLAKRALLALAVYFHRIPDSVLTNGFTDTI